MQVLKSTSQTITRPSDTTAYTSGDLVANSTTAGSVTPFSFRVGKNKGIKLWRVALAKSAASVTNASFRVHLYSDSPTVANGDNGAISSTASSYIGFIDIAAPATAFSNTYVANGIFVNNSLAAPLYFVSDADGYIYGLLEARGAYTPASAETFAVSIFGESYV